MLVRALEVAPASARAAVHELLRDAGGEGEPVGRPREPGPLAEGRQQPAEGDDAPAREDGEDEAEKDGHDHGWTP